MHATNLLLFLTAGLALNITPGPDMLFIIARSVSEGRAAGIVSALGIFCGTLVHMLAVTLGLASLLAAVPAAYDVVRYAGGAYLLYLGIRLIARPGVITNVATPAPAPLPVIFRQAMMTNVLNPKVAIFFLVFLPQFADRTAGHYALQLLALGLLFDISGTIVNIIVAVVASSAGKWTRERLSLAGVMERVTGVVFVGLGLRLALLGRR